MFYGLADHGSSRLVPVSECYLRVAKALSILSCAVGGFVFLAEDFRAEGFLLVR